MCTFPFLIVCKPYPMIPVSGVATVMSATSSMSEADVLNREVKITSYDSNCEEKSDTQPVRRQRLCVTFLECETNET